MPNSVSIANLSNGGTYGMPFVLQVTYTADVSGLEVAADYTGYPVSPKSAPLSGGSPTFELNWAYTETGTTVTVYLREAANPTVVLASDSRTGMAFIS